MNNFEVGDSVSCMVLICTNHPRRIFGEIERIKEDGTCYVRDSSTPPDEPGIIWEGFKLSDLTRESRMFFEFVVV